MFSFLNKPAARQPAMPSAESDETPASTASDSQIFLLLTRVCMQHSLLKICIGETDAAFTSAILEVVPEQRYLVLDELTPEHGHKRLLNEPNIRVSTLLDGLPLSFRTRVTQIGDTDGLPYYRVPFPSNVCYAQRRQEHRVPVPANRAMAVSFFINESTEIKGDLRDLSPSGFCARITTLNLESEFAGAIGFCRIGLSPTLELTVEAQLCHLDNAPGRQVPRIGVRFVEMTPETRRHIEQHVAELDRRQQRARRRRREVRRLSELR